MDTEQLGSFRTRPTGDGSLEVWARGWRLESQLYALIPMGLSLMFLFAPMAAGMRVVGASVMLLATLFAFRMTKPGLLLSGEAASIVSVVRTQRYPWAEVGGFMGERRHDEGRVLLVLEDGRQIPLPGTLDPGELDPYGDEGEVLSAVDQLNRLGERARAGELPRPVAPASVPLRPTDDDPTRKTLRAERKQIRAALKAVRLTADGTPEREVEPEAEPKRERRFGRRRATEPTPELTQVQIAEPQPTAPRREPAKEKSSGLPSYYPTPTYIPQAEYAQMLRDQKAAEKAAAAAAAELRELAELDELAEKEEFSDWTT